MPVTVPANRQANGVMPIRSMHQLMKTLPSGGCVVS